MPVRAARRPSEGAARVAFPARPASVVVAVVMALVASLFAGVGPASADTLPPVVPADTVAVTGAPRVGTTLTVDAGTWTPAGVTFTYAWYVDDALVDGASTDAFPLGAGLVGHAVAVEVTGSADGYAAAVRRSAPVVVEPGVLATTPVPTIEGVAQVGARLDAVAGTWDDGVTLSYQWLADGTAITGATAGAFTPAAAQLGRVLTVQVTGSRTGYAPATVTSAPTAAVAPAQLVAGTPTVSGTGRVAETLVAQPGTWSPVPSFSYQWFVSGTAVADARDASFVPRLTDQGKAVTVRVTGALPGYATRDAVSAPVTVGAPVFAATPTPTTKGIARVGTTLTVDTGAWSPTPSFTYQWLADGAVVTGATNAWFTPQAAHRTKRISVRVTGSIPGYPTTTRTSAQTAATAYGVFTSAPVPTVSGTVRVGTTLKAVAGAWAPAPSLAYQWLSNGVAIVGATKSWYTPQATQRGARITVTVTARRDGFITVTRTSAASPAVGWGVFTAAPVPRIAGYPQIGWVLTATPGTWSPAATTSYQWKANGVAIKGATARTYTPASNDYGKRLTVTVTARRAGFVNGVRTSVATLGVTKPFTRVSTPTVVGTTRVFSTLTARPGSWYPAPSFAYQWQRNGVAIKGATRSTYRLLEADYGKRITVKVTASRTGYTPAARTSAASAVVIGPAPTLKGDGTYRVGVSMGPGTFWAPGGNGCYWERRSTAGSDFAGVIANDFSLGGRRIVTISSTDAYFVTDGCGAWTRLATIGTPKSSFGAGAQKVGLHIRPGLYRAPGGNGCYWEALSGFSGLFSDVIDNDFSYYASQYVRIDAGVVGFDSHDCGTWTRVGD